MDLFSAFTAESQPIPKAKVNGSRRPEIDAESVPTEKRTKEGDDRMNKFLNLKMKELPKITYSKVWEKEMRLFHNLLKIFVTFLVVHHKKQTDSNQSHHKQKAKT